MGHAAADGLQGVVRDHACNSVILMYHSVRVSPSVESRSPRAAFALTVPFRAACRSRAVGRGSSCVSPLQPPRARDQASLLAAANMPRSAGKNW